MNCKNCGAEIPDGSKVCMFCGKQQGPGRPRADFGQDSSSHHHDDGKVIYQTNIYNQSSKVGRFKPCNKWVSLILCLALGGIGIHKLYEHKPGMFILYLFTFGLFGIGIIYDLVTILMRPTEYYP